MNRGDEPRFRQQAGGFTHWPATHVEFCRKDGLVETFTRSHFTAQDHPFDLLAHRASK